MEKRKIDLSKYAEQYEIQTVEGTDGTKVDVRSHIPYAEKEQMARELAERMIVIHDDSCVYLSSEYGKYKKYLVAKYYTDIDTEDMTPEQVADYFVNNDMWKMIGQICGWDYAIVEDIFKGLFDAVETTFNDDKSLTKALRTSFGFLFNGEDITESLAKAELTKDTMFKALDAINKKEQEVNVGELTVGGRILNFAKKE